MTNKCLHRNSYYREVPIIELSTLFCIAVWLFWISLTVLIAIGLHLAFLHFIVAVGSLDREPVRGQIETKPPVEYKQAIVEYEFEIEPVKVQFTDIYRGSRIDNEYYSLLKENCTTEEGLKLVIAISVAESGMGRDLPHRHSNFWGWFKNGDRNYDPSREEMAEVICKGIESYYMGVNTNYDMAMRYVGYDPSSWLNRVNWALGQM